MSTKSLPQSTLTPREHPVETWIYTIPDESPIDPAYARNNTYGNIVRHLVAFEN